MLVDRASRCPRPPQKPAAPNPPPRERKEKKRLSRTNSLRSPTPLFLLVGPPLAILYRARARRPRAPKPRPLPDPLALALAPLIVKPKSINAKTTNPLAAAPFFLQTKNYKMVTNRISPTSASSLHSDQPSSSSSVITGAQKPTRSERAAPGRPRALRPRCALDSQKKKKAAAAAAAGRLGPAAPEGEKHLGTPLLPSPRDSREEAGRGAGRG